MDKTKSQNVPTFVIPAHHDALPIKSGKQPRYQPLINSKWVVLLTIALLLGFAIIPTSADDSYIAGGDDDFIDLTKARFDFMTFKPVSCVNYMDEHMIEVEMFESKDRVQCRSSSAGTFIISISHYMNAHFNYQSLVEGANFNLPSDSQYLNCILLEQTGDSGQELYAQIGCLDRGSYTSTKLWIHVYTDDQCSLSYADGQTDAQRSKNGYVIDGDYFNTKVSFRPSFYSCASCKPLSIANSFSKQETARYNGNDDWLDDYFTDDAYYAVQQYLNNEVVYYKTDDDGFYTVDDDTRRLTAPMKEFTPATGELEKFEGEFWKRQRELYNDDDKVNDSIQSWNMCKKVHKYGLWCNGECRALNNFHNDEWTTLGISFLVMIFAINVSTMWVIYLGRLKVFQIASINANDVNAPDLGMPPLPLGLLFLSVLCCIIILASLKLVNGTLAVAIISCIFLLTYLLKLNKFHTKKHKLLGNAKEHSAHNFGVAL